MRVLMVAACPLPWPRGTPIRIHRMAEALHRRGHEVHVATYALGESSVTTSYLTHRVGRVDSAAAARPGPSLQKFLKLDPALIRRMAGLLREKSFDLIHAHHYEGLIAALLARRRASELPLIYDSHTLLASELPHYRLPIPKQLAAWLGLKLDRSLPRRADRVIAVTERMRDWFVTAGGVDAGRIALIPNGVEHEHFAVDEVNSGGGNGGPGTEPQIVFAGNLAEYQGIELLLAAFKLVRDRIPGARLVLATDSSSERLKGEIYALGLTDAVTTVPVDYAELPARLAQADVLVNPRPQCEGIPQKLLNYMAAGRPIVSFAGSAALLEHDRTAILAPDYDTAAFARAILRIFDEPGLGQRLGKAARAQVTSAYGWQQVAEKVEAVYAQSIAARRAPATR